MREIKINFIKNGKKTSKYELKPGTHPDPAGCTFVQVPDKVALDNITLDSVATDKDFETKVQIQANRNAFIDTLMSGDVQAQTDLKDAQAFLTSKQVKG